MGEVLLSVEQLGKKYCKSLKRGMLYGAIDIAGSFFGAMPKSYGLRPDEFWSLQDINFEVRRGECLGLIGPNGAGKSTLLKLLNGIITPDRGRITVCGRMGALIEVGAGFHPLLSGRENIYVNGSILGLRKEEIAKKFDEIVDFAGLSEFIDMPIKHYSSGMYVRLGFAIAAQMEPDILLIDEILAVGDAGFRSKCYNAISRLRERTAIVFVSHSMSAVSRMATHGLVIDCGLPVHQGNPAEAIAHYHRLFANQTSGSRQGNGSADIRRLRFVSQRDESISEVPFGAPLVVELEIEAFADIPDACVDLVFINIAEEVVAECHNHTVRRRIDLQRGKTVRVRAMIEAFTLSAGIYKVSALVLSSNMMTHHDWRKDFGTIEVTADRTGVAGNQFIAQWDVVDVEK